MDNLFIMKAIILLGTLKHSGLSNTEVLSEFFVEKASAQGIDCEIIKVVNENILPGTFFDMGEGDGWPAIMQRLERADAIIFATPIWWGSHSSEIQKVIERLDAVHDEILAGKESRLINKVGGIIITGDSDGAENIIGTFANFFTSIGMTLPPYTALSVLWEGQAKGKDTSREALWKKYEDEYASVTDQMITQLKRWS